jgi:hypothetical protein
VDHKVAVVGLGEHVLAGVEGPGTPQTGQGELGTREELQEQMRLIVSLEIEKA